MVLSGEYHIKIVYLHCRTGRLDHRIIMPNWSHKMGIVLVAFQRLPLLDKRINTNALYFNCMSTLNIR